MGILTFRVLRSTCRHHVVLTFVVRPNCIQSYARVSFVQVADRFTNATKETDSERRFHVVSRNDRIFDVRFLFFFS